ncbi:MAG: hypothetical protein P8K80_03575 [Phycisphaerales bacterium]|nr:hypothetical protein [Phycisphaerales bacterium]
MLATCGTMAHLLPTQCRRSWWSQQDTGVIPGLLRRMHGQFDTLEFSTRRQCCSVPGGRGTWFDGRGAPLNGNG